MYKGQCELWQSKLIDLKIQQAIRNFEKAIEKAPADISESVKNFIGTDILNFAYVYMNLCCDTFVVDNYIDDISNVYECRDIICEVLFPYIKQCGVETTEAENTIATIISKACDEGYNRILPYRNTENYSHYTYGDVLNAINLKKLAASFYSEQLKESKINMYKDAIVYATEYESQPSLKNMDTKKRLIDIIMECHEMIKELDPEYVIPERPQTSSSGGCYIATCVYGSYDCPQVWTLRRYRDECLSKTNIGRNFIRIYYTVSPVFVKWFGNTSWFKCIWKRLLDKMISKLQDDGIEDTPYKDK